MKKDAIALLTCFVTLNSNIHIAYNTDSLLREGFPTISPINFYEFMKMELPEISGIEPDYCFYIDKWAAVAGKKTASIGK
jgi:hypothetical protein